MAAKVARHWRAEFHMATSRGKRAYDARLWSQEFCTSTIEAFPYGLRSRRPFYTWWQPSPRRWSSRFPLYPPCLQHCIVITWLQHSQHRPQTSTFSPTTPLMNRHYGRVRYIDGEDKFRACAIKNMLDNYDNFFLDVQYLLLFVLNILIIIKIINL